MRTLLCSSAEERCFLKMLGYRSSHWLLHCIEKFVWDNYRELLLAGQKNCNNVISTFLDEIFEAVAVFLSSVLSQWCNEYTKFMYLYAIFWSPLLYQCTATLWWLVQLLECSWTPFPHVLQHFPLFRESALRLFALTNEINAYCTVRLIMTWINFNASRTLQHA